MRPLYPPYCIQMYYIGCRRLPMMGRRAQHPFHSIRSRTSRQRRNPFSPQHPIFRSIHFSGSAVFPQPHISYKQCNLYIPIILYTGICYTLWITVYTHLCVRISKAVVVIL